ncbi:MULTISPECIES: DUF3370 domain-containing protein [Limnospira]|uniref:DUF3370 domain-containing protein n=1 Tax=Limnospira indica PCC 8005 TaxID=376219 RepID=A0A9P1P023_9CYAN|nr:DUF3370 domain-containing protein [Limnospira indica]CDM96956.1 conserved hypothetical protein [Limnospira indica PCC 8005]
MLPLAIAPLILSVTPPPPVVITRPQEVRPLPGQLDNIPVFNSNSPEVVPVEGILLSTFPPEGKTQTNAHLNFPFDGRFDIFAHHIARPTDPEDLRTLYLGLLAYNPTSEPVTLEILQAASYLSQPDAPFIPLPPVLDNNDGTVFAGPGSRVMGEILRVGGQSSPPDQVIIPPQQFQMVFKAPIPVKTLEPPLNGRSLLMRLQSSGAVHIASLAQFAIQNPDGSESSPALESWVELLQNGSLVTPRDLAPTPPNSRENIIYGRVAGVALGSVWKAEITNLTIPEPGQAISYIFSSLPGGKLGTNQNQSAPMVVRYEDTAYQAHGNYGIQYSLTLDLSNPTNTPKTVVLTMETPLKSNELTDGGVQFFEEPPSRVFFRGTVRFRYTDDSGTTVSRYFHLVQNRGQKGEPLIELDIQPRTRRQVEFDFLYPPDASPPQVLTIKTLD